MKKKYFLLLLLCCFTKPLYTQVELSAYSEVSLVTAGPGNELFEAFGHSAIRIKDSVLQLDLIYNYGIFDWRAPNFYINFVIGRPLYNLGRQKFEYFKRSYKRQKRWLKQQVLDLTLAEKQSFFIYLEQNALPKNASYLYDPYYNNCATKLRDITSSILNNKIQFNEIPLEKKRSLRQLMDREISWNTWGSLGINVALGSKLDKKASASEYMYLPDYLNTAFKNATLVINNQQKKIIKREDVILDYKELKQKINVLNPLSVFLSILLISLLITYKDYKNNRRTKWLDFLLFFITGFIGFLIVFLWFFSNHSTAPNNFNFLWAFAPNLIVAFFLLKENQQKWIQKYMYVLLLFLIAIPFIWFTEIQQLPIAIIPLLILLLVRYLFLSKRLLTFKKQF